MLTFLHSESQTLCFLAISNCQLISHHPSTRDPKHTACLLYGLLSPTVLLDRGNLLPAEIPRTTPRVVPCPSVLAPNQEREWFYVLSSPGTMCVWCMCTSVTYSLTLKVLQNNVLLYNSLLYRIQCFGKQIQKCLQKKNSTDLLELTFPPGVGDAGFNRY